MKENGFTLIELMAAITLLSVMAIVAIPAFGNLFQNNTLTAVTNSFTSTIALARSEAIKRNVRISMCAMNDAGTNCGVNGEWEDGWVVWVDADNDDTIDAAELVIHQRDNLPTGYTLRSTNGVYSNLIVFNQDGESSGDGGVNGVDTLRVCDANAAANVNRSIQLNAVGRAFVDKNLVGTGCP